MMILIDFCLNTVFTFDGKIYKQVKDTPMGSSPRLCYLSTIKGRDYHVLLGIFMV